MSLELMKKLSLPNIEKKEKIKVFSIFCDAHGYVAKGIPQEDVQPMATAHREKENCFYPIHVDIHFLKEGD